MTRALPPLDAHAHIDPKVGARELEQLGAVVFVATRSVEEFECTVGRNDRLTIWGLGCHPGVASAQRNFDPHRFAVGLRRTPFVSEIGLDGRSRVPLQRQAEVFKSILDLAIAQPRLLSVHSFRAVDPVLGLIEHSGIRGVVLHWWTGTQMQTKRAIELGCYFSVNDNMDLAGTAIHEIPLNRILTETDHPSGNRRGRAVRQPGWTMEAEKVLAGAREIEMLELRNQIWRNLAALAYAVEVTSMLPAPVQSMLRAATTGSDHH